MAKVAFLNSPYILNEPFFQHMPPLSILYLSAYVQKYGHKARIFNLDRTVNEKGIYFFGFDLQRLFSEIDAFSPDMIGITCPYSSRWPFTERLTKILRSRFKDMPIVIGGIHPTTFPEYCLDSSGADLVVIGEGEETTVNLLGFIDGDNDLEDIEGIAFRSDAGLTVNPKVRFIDNLDSIPFPAYELIDIEGYKVKCAKDRISQLKGIYFSLLTSRSCPNQCTYCNMHLAHGKRWRYRSPENVLSEIEHLIKTYQVRQFAIVDDNFSFSRQRTIEILTGIINRGLKIKFITPNGLSIKTLDDEVIKLLKDAGALEIAIAIESGSEFIRNEVYKKRLSTEKIIEVVNSCKRHKLPCKAFFMVGAPEETDDTVRESIELMKKIRIPAYINITTPYKGTKLYDYYLSKGVIDEKSLMSGTVIDIRLPVERLQNYDSIIRWKRDMQVHNILYSWKDILLHSGFINVNTIKRLARGVLFPKGVNSEVIAGIINKHMPL